MTDHMSRMASAPSVGPDGNGGASPGARSRGRLRCPTALVAPSVRPPGQLQRFPPRRRRRAVAVSLQPTSVGRSLTALEGPGCGRQGRDDPIAPHLLHGGLDGADESQPSAHQRRALGQDVVRRIRRLPAQGAAGTAAVQVVTLRAVARRVPADAVCVGIGRIPTSAPLSTGVRPPPRHGPAA